MTPMLMGIVVRSITEDLTTATDTEALSTIKERTISTTIGVLSVQTIGTRWICTREEIVQEVADGDLQPQLFGVAVSCCSFCYSCYSTEMKKHVSHSLEETSQIAQEWLARLSTRPSSEEATVVGLLGHLGAGKTAFVKAVAKHLGVPEEITSPTFVIMKLYPLKKALWKCLVHIDAYRLESGKETEALDFEKVIADKGNLVLIEWPENIQEALQGLSCYSRITCSAGEKETERIIIEE